MNSITIEWNEYHEELLKKWAEMSKTYNIIHSLCAQYYTTWNKRLGVPIIIIGGITASSILSNKNSSLAWTYINGALALLMTVLSGVSNFLGIIEKINKHQTASFKYSKIAMDIDMVLSFGRSNRNISPDDFIQEIKISILNCRENAPEILPWIMADYINKLDKSITDTTSIVNNQNDQNDQDQCENDKKDTHIEHESEIVNNIKKPGDIRKSLHLSLSNKKQNDNVVNDINVNRIHSDFTDKMSLEMIKTGKKIAQAQIQVQSQAQIQVQSQTGKSAKTYQSEKTGKSVQSAKSVQSSSGENIQTENIQTENITETIPGENTLDIV